MLNNGNEFISESFLVQKIGLISGMYFLGINYGMGIVLAFFISSDTFFGIIKSITLYGWTSINQNKFWVGFLTKIGVLFIPISIAISGAFLGFELNSLVSLSMYTLIANDAISCYTNILSIKKKKDFKNKDLIEMLITFLRSLIYNQINNFMKKLKEDGCELPENEKQLKEDEN